MSKRAAICLSMEFNLDAPNATRDDLHGHGKQVMEKLLDLEQRYDDFTDSSVSTDAAANTITIELLVWDRVKPIDALRRALQIVHAAVLASGASTPDWPVVIEQPDHVEMAKARDLVPA